MKKWGFDPKICFQGSYSFSDVFLGSNAHFLTSYNHFLASGSFFLSNFMKFRRKRDILGENIPICSQTWGFWKYKLKKKSHSHIHNHQIFTSYFSGCWELQKKISDKSENYFSILFIFSILAVSIFQKLAFLKKNILPKNLFLVKGLWSVVKNSEW